MRAGLDYLRARTDAGRQLVRPLGRQLHLWHLVGALRAERGRPATAPHRCVRKAADWLIAIQNPDGGWGEDCDSYKLDYRGYEPAASTASQTAWALLGLMAAGEVDHPAVARGIAYLQPTQDATGCGGRTPIPAAAFPRVFYLRYHGYPKFFPLWALARYRNLKPRQCPARRAAACDDPCRHRPGARTAHRWPGPASRPSRAAAITRAWKRCSMRLAGKHATASSASASPAGWRRDCRLVGGCVADAVRSTAAQASPTDPDWSESGWPLACRRSARGLLLGSRRHGGDGDAKGRASSHDRRPGRRYGIARRGALRARRASPAFCGGCG